MPRLTLYLHRPPVSNPGMRVLLSLFLALFVACAGPPDADQVTITSLTTAIDRTLNAMALPIDQRPEPRVLRDQAGLLAIQIDSPRRDRLLNQAIDPAEVVAAARDRLAEFARRQPNLQPPNMLVWLVEHGAALDRDQLLLLDCLSCQLAREAQLEHKPKPPSKER